MRKDTERIKLKSLLTVTSAYKRVNPKGKFKKQWKENTYILATESPAKNIAEAKNSPI